jgi:tetratricopeptide (TPR) repeat protein
MAVGITRSFINLDMKWLLLLSFALQDERSPLEALAAAQEAAIGQPEKADLQFELGLLYASLGRTNEAIAALGRAAKLAPEEASYALAYGEVLYRAGRASEALPHLEKASSIPDALLLLASVHEKLGDAEKTVAELTRYVEAKPEDLGARLLLGSKLEEAKRLDEALALYRSGTDGKSLARAAELLSRRPETHAEAESIARKALEAEPSLLEPRIVLARVLSRTGRDAEALAELERAAAEHPEASQVHYNLAQAYQRSGRTTDAQESARRFQELEAKEKSTREREARVAVTYKRAAETLQKGDMLEAEKVFRSVLEIDPENAQSRSMLAKIAFSRNDPASAKRWIEEAIERSPDVAEYHYLKGLFAARTGNPAEAEPSVRRSLELDPAFPEAWSLLGSLLLDSRRADEALPCFLRAAVLEPSNPAVQLNLASVYSALGRAVEEEAAMERYRALSGPSR